MNEALKQAEIAYELGEIPIGAVITQNGKIIESIVDELKSDWCCSNVKI